MPAPEPTTATDDPAPDRREGSAEADTEGRELAVRCEGLTKTFGTGRAEVKALRGVDLHAHAGELLYLVGPSGCGKTTLVSIISGVLSPTQGTVELFGRDWAQLSDAQRTARRGELVGFVFQDFNLIPTLTVAENVAVPLLLRGQKKQAPDRAAEMLDRVGLGDRADARPTQLSGGMQQRVAVARALIAKPRLLVCDEPTASLDGETGQSVMQLIREVAAGDQDAEGGRCVLVVTHDNRIFHFADRIVEMEDGQIKPELSDNVQRQLQRSREDFQNNSDEPDDPASDETRDDDPDARDEDENENHNQDNRPADDDRA